MCVCELSEMKMKGCGVKELENAMVVWQEIRENEKAMEMISIVTGNS